MPNTTTTEPGRPGLDQLQHALLDRFDSRPFSEWPPQLLRTMIAAFDLWFAGRPQPTPGQPARLQLVGDRQVTR